jgi:cytoskeletal protein CcmA (bactofilin family)
MALFGKQEKNEDGALRDAAASQGAPSARPVPPPAAGGRDPRDPTRNPRQEGTTMANIGKSITISGDLTGEEDLVIEGKVEGKVSLPNNQLTIGADGSVKAEVAAKSVIVIGRVAGNVRGAERVEIQGTGIVEGDVAAPKLIVAEGAVLNGSISMGNKATATATATAASAPPTGEVRKAG